ncbi:MAG: hypothetical protein AAGC78_06550 [Cellvibrio sp.]|uniref:hypothetical protein n=1 Tax=Cellvibrio sp. TaxID=1965322 RepID=UPI0031A83A59
MKEAMGVLPLKDQVIICVTDALAATNRYLEACPHFSAGGKLEHISFHTRNIPQVKIFHLSAEYDSNGLIVGLGGSIVVKVNSGLMNYNHVFSELQKIIPHINEI